MNITGYNNGVYKLRCEKCDSLVDVKEANCFVQYGRLHSRLPIICSCGNSTFDLGENTESCKGCNVIESTKIATVEHKEAPVCCPKCKSIQISAGNKGFGLGKAVAGALIAGPIGALGGFLGSSKTVITCMKCGYRWQPSK